ncbi:hypothetical protein CEXT_617851 [Caerostris extrusa]|uniref:Uncharacterized protein n=1 Tax=Caerostris extrusa TaxID=172846 RepID=A0AAV4PJQ1_CAEEX|nr:hypothetical protein CEXT_617851 [Caerostris extrusa]
MKFQHVTTSIPKQLQGKSASHFQITSDPQFLTPPLCAGQFIIPPTPGHLRKHRSLPARPCSQRITAHKQERASTPNYLSRDRQLVGANI